MASGSCPELTTAFSTTTNSSTHVAENTQTIAFSPFMYELVGVVVLIVLIIGVFGVRSHRRVSKPTYRARAQHRSRYCNSCGAALRWAPQYQRYYCPNEKRYV
jgi:Trk-type K+ transport system membrane component